MAARSSCRRAAAASRPQRPDPRASVPAPSIWAIPKDLDGDARSRARLAQLLGMTVPSSTTACATTRTSSGCGARSTTVAWRWRPRIRGIHQVREYKRKYPGGRGRGARGRLHQRRGPRPGRRRARVREGARRHGRHAARHQGPARPRRRGRRRQHRSRRRAATSASRRLERCSSSPTSASATPSPRTRPKAGSVVVLDAQSGEVLALGRTSRATCPATART
jgi:cell division protein FtsI (penicillin-binding protein 3)